MIAHALVFVLVALYIAIATYGHILLVPEGRQHAFKRRGERYLDVYCRDPALWSGGRQNA